MKKIIIFTTLIVLQVTALAQYKPLGYIHFEQSHKTDSFEMYLIETSPVIYNYKINIEGVSAEPRRFSPVDSSKYQIVDSLYIKQLDIKPLSWLFDPDIDRDFGWYWDKNGNLETGPFRRLYIVEKLEQNRFKIIVIVPLIGSVFEKERQ